MPFDYEALVGHLYVVGGRSISATPPGTLVEVAPKKAARGREADTFFTVVLPSGEKIAPAAFYEQMAQLSAERYFNSSGSVTSGLRAVFNSLNEDLFEHNTGDAKHYEASILCAVLRGGDLYLGRVGSGVALFRYKHDVQPFPEDFSSDEALFGVPLGVQPMPDVKMAHYEVMTGTRLILADASLADIDMTKLTTAIASEDVAAVLAALKEVVTAQGTLLAAEFVPPEVPASIPVREGESTAMLNAAVAAAGEAVTTAPAAVATDRPPRQRRTSSPLEVPLRTGLSKGALGLAKGAEVTGHVIDRLMPPPKEGQRSLLSSPVAAGAAVLVPIVVVILVLVMWLNGTDVSEFDQCVDRANTAAGVARGIASSDVAGTLAAWNAVITVAAECDAIRPGDVMLAAMSIEGRQIIDSLLQVERRALTPITALPNAGLTRIVLQGEDIYALDDRNDLVYRVKLNPDGVSIVQGSQQAIPSMRRTASVAEFTIGDILDITWAVDGGGLSQGNVLVALDTNGVLIECPPRFLESLSCAAQQLLNTETWSTPKAITMWQGRLYLLDPGANQIWRYEPGSGAFTNSPTEYFVGESRPDIRTAIDFGIDDDGELYVLLADGDVKKFVSGEEVPFGFASFPDGQQIRTANALFLNNNPIAQGLYIVDQQDRTVYETTLAGTFIAAYRPQDEEMFASVADVVVDSNQNFVYALSGNSIFAFDRSP